MISIRALEPGDREAFQAFVRGLSQDSRTNRFLSPIRELAPGVLQALTQPDQARHVGLVALEDGRIVGEGRYVTLDEGRRGEFAIAVADEWQRRGLGARILGALAHAARRAGVAILEGEVLRTNAAMLNFMRRAGFRLRACPGDASLAIAERDLHSA